MLKHEEQQALIERILNSFDDRMENTIANIEALVNKLLLENGFTETTALNFEVLFDQALNEAGYFQQVNDFIDNDFDELFGLIKGGIETAGFAVEYTAEDLDRIMALKDLQLDRFNTLTSSSGKEISQKLYKYALSDMSLDDMQRQIREDFKGTALAKYSKTIARTSIKDFQESMIDMKAKELDAVWIYVGVSDSKTRDFCNCVLGKKHYYDKSDKSKLQADPKRAYNCRHRFRPVSEEFAKTSGYTKGEASC